MKQIQIENIAQPVVVQVEEDRVTAQLNIANGHLVISRKTPQISEETGEPTQYPNDVIMYSPAGVIPIEYIDIISTWVTNNFELLIIKIQ